VVVHGGTISVYSEGEGTGSTFTLKLPMSRDNFDGDSDGGASSDFGYRLEYEAGPGNESASAGLVLRNEHNRDQNRILGPSATKVETFDSEEIARTEPKSQSELLVVDDSHLNRKMLIKVLEAKGYACEEAEDGQLALAKVKLRLDEGRGEYAAILMDFMMPNMDGPTATRELRKLGYRGPIIGVTGNALQSDVDHFTSNGATAVLTKPFKLTEFQRIINKENEKGQ
jgi:CheY-like chemotaxis protein